MKASARINNIPRTALINMLAPRSSTALARAALEALPLRPHPRDILIELVHLLLALFGPRLLRLVLANLAEGLLDRKLLVVTHHPSFPDPGHPTLYRLLRPAGEGRFEHVADRLPGAA